MREGRDAGEKGQARDLGLWQGKRGCGEWGGTAAPRYPSPPKPSMPPFLSLTRITSPATATMMTGRPDDREYIT